MDNTSILNNRQDIPEANYYDAYPVYLWLLSAGVFNPLAFTIGLLSYTGFEIEIITIIFMVGFMGLLLSAPTLLVIMIIYIALENKLSNFRLRLLLAFPSILVLYLTSDVLKFSDELFFLGAGTIILSTLVLNRKKLFKRKIDQSSFWK